MKQFTRTWVRTRGWILLVGTLLCWPGAYSRSEPSSPNQPVVSKKEKVVDVMATAQWIPYVNRSGKTIESKKTLEVSINSPKYAGWVCDISIRFHKSADKIEHAKQLLLSRKGFSRTFFGPYPFARVANGLWYVNLKIIDHQGKVVTQRQLNAVRGTLEERTGQFRVESQWITYRVDSLESLSKRINKTYSTLKTKKDPAKQEEYWQDGSDWMISMNRWHKTLQAELKKIDGLSQADLITASSVVGDHYPRARSKLLEMRNILKSTLAECWKDLSWQSEIRVYERKIVLTFDHDEDSDEPWTEEKIETEAKKLAVDYPSRIERYNARFSDRLLVIRERLNRQSEVTVGRLYIKTKSLFALYDHLVSATHAAQKRFQPDRYKDFPKGWAKRIGAIHHLIEKYQQEKENGYAVQVEGFDAAISVAMASLTKLRNHRLISLYEQHNVDSKARETVVVAESFDPEQGLEAFLQAAHTLGELFERERHARKSGFLIARDQLSRLQEEIITRLASKRAQYFFREATRNEEWLDDWNQNHERAMFAITHAEDVDDVVHFMPKIAPLLREAARQVSLVRDQALQLHSRPEITVDDFGDTVVISVDKDEIKEKIEAMSKAFTNNIQKVNALLESPLFPNLPGKNEPEKSD